jgi:hypothetical protein
MQKKKKMKLPDKAQRPTRDMQIEQAVLMTGKTQVFEHSSWVAF